jgi:hypothetical protein
MQRDEGELGVVFLYQTATKHYDMSDGSKRGGGEHKGLSIHTHEIN